MNPDFQSSNNEPNYELAHQLYAEICSGESVNILKIPQSMMTETLLKAIIKHTAGIDLSQIPLDKWTLKLVEFMIEKRSSYIDVVPFEKLSFDIVALYLKHIRYNSNVMDKLQQNNDDSIFDILLRDTYAVFHLDIAYITEGVIRLLYAKDTDYLKYMVIELFSRCMGIELFSRCKDNFIHRDKVNKILSFIPSDGFTADMIDKILPYAAYITISTLPKSTICDSLNRQNIWLTPYNITFFESWTVEDGDWWKHFVNQNRYNWLPLPVRCDPDVIIRAILDNPNIIDDIPSQAWTEESVRLISIGISSLTRSKAQFYGKIPIELRHFVAFCIKDILLNGEINLDDIPENMRDVELCIVGINAKSHSFDFVPKLVRKKRSFWTSIKMTFNTWCNCPRDFKTVDVSMRYYEMNRAIHADELIKSWENTPLKIRKSVYLTVLKCSEYDCIFLRMLKDLPDKRDSILEYIVKTHESGFNKIPIEDRIRYIGLALKKYPHLTNICTPEELLDCLGKNPDLYKTISKHPDIVIPNGLVCRLFKQDPSIFPDVDSSHYTPEMCCTAVEYNPDAVKTIGSCLELWKKINLEEIPPQLIQYIPASLLTQELVNKLFKVDTRIIGNIPLKYVTDEIIYVFLNANGPINLPQGLLTREIICHLCDANLDNIIHIPVNERSELSDEILKRVVQEKPALIPLIIDVVNMRFEESDSIHWLILQKNPHFLKNFPKQVSDEVFHCKFAWSTGRPIEDYLTPYSLSTIQSIPLYIIERLFNKDPIGVIQYLRSSVTPKMWQIAFNLDPNIVKKMEWSDCITRLQIEEKLKISPDDFEECLLSVEIATKWAIYCRYKDASKLEKTLEGDCILCSTQTVKMVKCKCGNPIHLECSLKLNPNVCPFCREPLSNAKAMYVYPAHIDF